LVTGAFLLPFARLADIYGAYIVFTSGLIWLCVWSLISGFSQNYLMLTLCRALQGFGPAAFLPSGIMLLGTIYRPGPRKNLVFCLYGTFSPIGFFSGIFIGGLSGDHLRWNWYFWIAAIVLAIVSYVALVTIPSNRLDECFRKVNMDWLGAATIVPGSSSSRSLKARILPPAGLHLTFIQPFLSVSYFCAVHFMLRVGRQKAHFCLLTCSR
jgi:MFS family permease